ncbi:MAG: flagellar hook assembly protein FlgD [Pseudomonadota bacterium]
MSVTDTTSGLTLNQVLANSAGQTRTTDNSLGDVSKAASGSSALGKDAFLQLLVTQLKNQNPLDPQDNTAFVAQLAQFSSLEGITTLNDTVNALSGNFQSSQALQASSLVGRSVIVQTSEAYVDPASEKPFSGTVVVKDADSKPVITITDADGEVVRTIDMGTQKAGNADFTWDGKDDDGLLLDKGSYTFTASSKTDTGTTALTTYLPATVNSVTLSKTGGEIMLNLAGLGSIGMSKVQTIGL